MNARVCVLPRVEGLGGMATFRLKFEQALRARGVEVSHDSPEQADAVLVIAGTRDLPALIRARRRGVRIVQRLDGINWVHRKKNTGVRHFLRAEYGNLVLSFIRGRIASRVVYQSAFSKNWWEDWYGETRVPSCVIHNGADLKRYAPQEGIPPAPPYRLLLAEGNLGGGYEMGLENALALAESLNANPQTPVELLVAGSVSPQLRAQAEAKSRAALRWLGVVPREEIPALMRSAHLLFSADLHPACPNAVIEALSCGLPVVAFDTGAALELVGESAGRVVPYGANSWALEKPDIPSLARAAQEVLQRLPAFRAAARARAESLFDLEKMTDAYLKALLE